MRGLQPDVGGKRGEEQEKKLILFSIHNCKIKYEAKNLKTKNVFELVMFFLSEFSTSSYLNSFWCYPPSKYPTLYGAL
jgi:hypothetical protein